MLKAIGWLVKLAVFSVVILVLGNWLRWDGKTVSDQIRTHLSQAERSDTVSSVRKWAGSLVEDARRGTSRLSNPDQFASKEEIKASERQKLRALIRELNRSQ